MKTHKSQFTLKSWFSEIVMIVIWLQCGSTSRTGKWFLNNMHSHAFWRSFRISGLCSNKRDLENSIDHLQKVKLKRFIVQSRYNSAVRDLCWVTRLRISRIRHQKSTPLQLINWALMDRTDCQHVADGGVSETLLPASLEDKISNYCPLNY